MLLLTKILIILNFLSVIFNLSFSLERKIVTPVRLDPNINGKLYFERNAGEANYQGVIFKISAFDEDFYLNLLPDSNFIAPAFTMHYLGFSPNPTRNLGLGHCFFSGNVNSDRESFAALSLCGGLRGAFGYKGAEYLLHPLQNDTASSTVASAEGAHVIHRRSAPPHSGHQTSRCGVGSTFNHGVLEALEKYKAIHSRPKGDPNDTGSKSWSRSKRFASLPRYVETLVVADESMAKFHGDDLKHYLLTLMAVAARLYKHPSILNPVNIVVVKFMVIGEDDKGPKVSSNAALTLRNFCTWQKRFNKVSDKHPEYWDTAILFTKQDLCGSTTCDTLGMADVGTMCDPKRSCSVIEDDGLPSAFTTAHELGHVFNMPHDNVKACEEAFGKLKDNHMMSPTLIQIDRSNPWSPCSAAIITDFLDNGHGDCLLDEPVKPIILPQDLSGTSYTLNKQCELAFGAGSKPCPYMQSCNKLWCTGKARGQLVCQTRHFPWADGTSCGDEKFCLKGVCVEKHNTTKYKLDGGWGKWGPYGTCSRTCGGGVQLAKRECNNPVPTNGGKYCEGIRVKYRSCNLNPCKETGKSFREEQCESFNGYNHSTNRLSPSVVWVPKYSGVSPKDKCKLICRANGTGYFYVLASKVVDGTPCMPDSSAVCVQGKCIKAGCDGKLGSSKRFDKCGVCGGDSKSCKKVSGLFTKPIHGYNFVVMIPAGASSIDIRQRGYRGMVSDDNYLAVKNGQGKYLLNGHFIVSAVERDIMIKGSLLRYSGTATSVETLQAFKPIQEPLTIEVLSVGKMTPPRVRYFFYLPKENKEDKSSYKKEQKAQILNNSILTDSKRVYSRKPDYKRPAYKWAVTNWDECSVTCGNGLQKRTVECRDAAGQVSSQCNTAQRPNDLRICGDPCPVWEVGEWTPCSKTCGRGFKRRLLKCTTETGLLLPRDHCNLKRKPQELDFCTLRPC
ncbi:A disintegrin and metalloproteinase with thrombospondin motifs 15 [Latimeria chalumnae]|uniref:A disintegrin and metalloproteinase with thrombospondin motifs 15 n=1 Tax=Latimeria chalumnae TaxID=7897 RepID=UPI0003C1A2B7|nr:PREDICTED: A disintegrin and metalloproteinase with thrombospondin motifs 15 [Latimeria chalumnae]|eukprot:XP_005999975.1 PREDICTED: A disintegrin and metalloproteinase with thrombospondin motifs 15 [Latimeria chalumnae]